MRVAEPFILRRSKDGVRSELPPKTRHVKLQNLTRSQRIAYEDVLAKARSEKKLRQETEWQYFNELRIICLHSALRPGIPADLRPLAGDFLKQSDSDS